jgi:hypothetical protein
MLHSARSYWLNDVSEHVTSPKSSANSNEHEMHNNTEGRKIEILSVANLNQDLFFLPQTAKERNQFSDRTVEEPWFDSR